MNIRMPNQAERLLRFVAGSRTANPEHAIFPTFADLFMAGACLGFSRDILAPTTPAFVTGEPRPIDYSVFRNQGYHEILLLIAIAQTGDATVADRMDEVAQIAERYAAEGLRIMAESVETTGHPSLWIQAWQDIVLGASADAPRDPALANAAAPADDRVP